MRSHPDNPPGNVLPSGIAEGALIGAIGASGYPLQGVVAARLLPHFHVVEEWGYVDDTSKEHRSLDIYAYRKLSEVEESKLHIGLRLLVECKRSKHPFVFFQQVVPRGATHFPHISGLPNRSISIRDPSGKNQTDASPDLVLGLDTDPYVVNGPPVCASFSKAVPSGKKVDLSGTDPFNTIVLPLVKALRHTLGQSHRPNPTQPIFPTMELCIAVLDAPILVVESPDRSNDPILQPWVRVVRHESHQEASGFWRSRFYTIDVVHTDFLASFLTDHLLPLTETFSEGVRKMEDVLRHGGQVPSLDKWSWNQIRRKSETHR